jgi:predicted Abi (CAAX) family protease
MYTGMLRWQPIYDSRALGWLSAYALGRSAVEELVFRAAMLPHPKVNKYVRLSCFLSLDHMHNSVSSF